MSDARVIILVAHREPGLSEVRRLFREYIEALPFELTFQDYERELTELTAEYSPPAGRLLLARHRDVAHKPAAGMAVASHQGRRNQTASEHQATSGRAATALAVSESSELRSSKDANCPVP